MDDGMSIIWRGLSKRITTKDAPAEGLHLKYLNLMRYLPRREATFWWPDCYRCRNKPWRSCTFRFDEEPDLCRSTGSWPMRRSLPAGWTWSERFQQRGREESFRAGSLERTGMRRKSSNYFVIWAVHSVITIEGMLSVDLDAWSGFVCGWKVWINIASFSWWASGWHNNRDETFHLYTRVDNFQSEIV